MDGARRVNSNAFRHLGGDRRPTCHSNFGLEGGVGRHAGLAGTQHRCTLQSLASDRCCHTLGEPPLFFARAVRVSAKRGRE